jgi:hypothetical protein
MGYSEKFKQRVEDSPRTLGNQLGRWAIYHHISAQQLALVTGATRQTIYNWFTGSAVIPAYREKAETVLRTLINVQNGEDAWRALCQQFNIRT